MLAQQVRVASHMLKAQEYLMAAINLTALACLCVQAEKQGNEAIMRSAQREIVEQSIQELLPPLRATLDKAMSDAVAKARAY